VPLQVYRWPGATYQGEVRAGKRHGRGAMSFDDSPAVYEGDWADGMRHGRGVLYFNAERTAFYEGGPASSRKRGCRPGVLTVLLGMAWSLYSCLQATSPL
jgi:hypothetical protein